MARRLAWSDVRGGMVASVAFLVAITLTVMFSRVGSLHGRTFRLYAIVGEARGLTRGSEVWLSGKKTGRVLAIHFRPPQVADTARRLQIDMEVLERDRLALRRDAVAQIRSGGSLIGPPVVYLSPGTVHAPVVQPGDTIQARPQADVQEATVRFGAATRELPIIVGNVKRLAAELRSTDGTAGAVLNGQASIALQRAHTSASRLAHRLTGGSGAGAVMRGDLGVRARSVMARVDSVRTLLGSQSTSLGRFRRDSTLLRDMAGIRDELALLRRQIDEPRGTVGRALHDTTLQSTVAEAHRQMTLLFADVKAHPLRYLSF